MIAVAVVHEEVHDRTGEKNKEGQHAEQMGAMLGQKIEERDGKKPPEHALRDDPSARVIYRCHVSIPCKYWVRRTFPRTAPDVYA